MKRKCKLLVLILILILVATFTPTVSYAYDGAIFIGNNSILQLPITNNYYTYGNNAGDIIGINEESISNNSWSWAIKKTDSNDYELILNEAIIRTGYTFNDNNCIHLYGIYIKNLDVKIKLIGDNLIDLSNVQEHVDYSAGIESDGGNITFETGGSNTGNLSILSGRADNSNLTFSSGLSVLGKLVINSGCINCSGGAVSCIDISGAAFSYGVYADEIIMNGGSLTGSGDATANANAPCSRGIYGGNITVNSGEIKGYGGNSNNINGLCYSIGIDARDMNVADGLVVGHGGDITGDFSYGVSAGISVCNDANRSEKSELIANGGIITGNGGRSIGYSCGIYTFGSNIIANNGLIEGYGGFGSNSLNYPILCSAGIFGAGDNDSITIDGGIVHGYSDNGVPSVFTNQCFGVGIYSTQLNMTSGSAIGNAERSTSSVISCAGIFITNGGINLSGGLLTAVGCNAYVTDKTNIAMYPAFATGANCVSVVTASAFHDGRSPASSYIPSDIMNYKYIQVKTTYTPPPTPAPISHHISYTRSYKITASAQTGGAISFTGNLWIDENHDATYEIIPDDGYKIDEVFVDGENVTSQLINNSYTFKNIKANHTISASFKKIITNEDMINITNELKLTARSIKTPGGNIKVTAKTNLNNFNNKMYEIEYKFFKSNKKNSNYVAVSTGKSNTYTLFNPAKGKYYFKTIVIVKDLDGNIIAKTNLKQCKYACRIK